MVAQSNANNRFICPIGIVHWDCAALGTCLPIVSHCKQSRIRYQDEGHSGFLEMISEADGC